MIRGGRYYATHRLLMKNDASVIEKTIELKAPPARVWRALTDYREFGEWFRVKLEGPFALGQTARGHITYPGYEHYKWEAVVQKMEAERLFAFTWHPYAVDQKRDYSQEKPTLVEFKLEKTADGTRLTITESGFEGVPADRRVEAFRMNDGGWTEQACRLDRGGPSSRPCSRRLAIPHGSGSWTSFAEGGGARSPSSPKERASPGKQSHGTCGCSREWGWCGA